MGQNKFKVGIRGIPRVLYSFLMSSLIAPFNIVEKILLGNTIKMTSIDKPPIFIIGHWRSGTTYLHNLMSQDRQFGFPTTFQTVTPGLFLRFERLIKPIVAASLPPKRPEDDVDLGADLPQEEEYALGNLSPFSFYNGWIFPKNMEFYHKFVSMNNVSDTVISEWKQIYSFFLKKVSCYFSGKQLIVKNPSNTARIKLLLELFPNAKFIHIYRNPYHTYLSMKRNIETEMTLYCIQKPYEEEKIERLMIDLYNNMYVKYFKEKSLIPKANLYELRYEDLIAFPLKNIMKIYESLSLDFSDITKKQLEVYIESQKKIKTHSYIIDDILKRKIYKNLKFTIEKWGYYAV